MVGKTKSSQPDNGFRHSKRLPGSIKPYENACSGNWWVTSSVLKLRFSNNAFQLIGYDSDAFHRATHEIEVYSVNYLTRKYSITKSQDREDSTVEKTEWFHLKKRQFRRLDSLESPFIEIE